MELAAHYSRFKVSERLLFTGHSHQAWPDVAFDAHMQAFHDAATCVDEKWENAFVMADKVRAGFRRLLDDNDGLYALAPSTHDLLIKFLSALDLKKRPRLITTSGEFHSLNRQLRRLIEEGINVVFVDAHPADTLTGRLITEINDKTAAVMVSTVFFETARIVTGWKAVLDACEKHGAELLIDAYHALNVVPFSLGEQKLQRAYVVGGGYKYCQLGEGNCFLRFPKDCELRPVYTGWFADYDALATGDAASKPRYGKGGQRFTGASYDPTSHYRAAAVFDFFARHGLTSKILREVSQRQIGLLAAEFDELDLDPKLIGRDRETPFEKIGGFLALSSPHAGKICGELKSLGVLTDSRGQFLRFGPAPYLSDDQIRQAMAGLKKSLIK